MASDSTPDFGKKLRAVSDLFELAFRLKFEALRRQYPEKPDEDIRKLVLEAIERGTR